MTPHIKYFIQKKMAEDELWKKLKVVYSGHEVPGEGEHKILAYIRSMKMQPDFDPQFSFCIYGLDADLIFLSLVIHETSVVLLREEVVFGPIKPKKNARKMHIKSDTFQLLHLSVLRNYLQYEFQESYEKAGIPMDLEMVIDDFVLMCMLVGNDFIPHLPSMDIGEGGLDVMIELYKEVVPKRHGYFTDGMGGIRWSSFQILLARLSQIEPEIFEKRDADLKKYLKQMKKRMGAEKFKQSMGTLIARSKETKDNDDDEEDFNEPLNSGNADDDGLVDGGDEDNSLDELANEAINTSYKGRYYQDKFEDRMNSGNALNSLCKDYMEALMWIMLYYYQGVRSWGWFFPHFYSPLASDLVSRDLDQLSSEIQFNQGTPFLPCEQLLGVLPPDSSALVPKPLDSLMLDKSSPIKDFYPEEFKEDYNGKKNDWETVVLIPFVDEKSNFDFVYSLLIYFFRTVGRGHSFLSKVRT
jgi:5'-3' exoribonuclease 1